MPASRASQARDGHWAQQRENIVAAAQIVGVDPGVLARIAAFESGFNHDAAPIARDAERNTVRLFDGRMGISSAHGLGQFTDATWLDTINRYGAAHGIAGAGQRGGRPGSLTAEQARQYRADPRVQAAMLAELTRDNMELGRRIGGESDDANVYALHNLGAGDGARLLQAVRNNQTLTVRDALVAGREISPGEARRIEAVIRGNQALYGDGTGSVERAYARMAGVMAAGDRYAEAAHTLMAERNRPASAPAPAVPTPPAPVTPPAAPAPAPPSRSALTREALRGLQAPPPVQEGPKSPDVPPPAPAPAERQTTAPHRTGNRPDKPASAPAGISSSGAKRPVQVVALRPADASAAAVPRAPVFAVVAAPPAAPPVAEVVRAEQYARDRDEEPPVFVQRRAGPVDRQMAHTAQGARAPIPRRDPFEDA